MYLTHEQLITWSKFCLAFEEGLNKLSDRRMLSKDRDDLEYSFINASIESLFLEYLVDDDWEEKYIIK